MVDSSTAWRVYRRARLDPVDEAAGAHRAGFRFGIDEDKYLALVAEAARHGAIACPIPPAGPLRRAAESLDRRTRAVQGHVIVFDDFVADTASEFRRLLAFLDVLRITAPTRSRLATEVTGSVAWWRQ